jgi:hypothetical protein
MKDDDNKNKTPDEASLARGHEVSDVKIAGITWFLALLTVGCVFVGWLMVALINRLEANQKEAWREARPSPFAAERPKLPPEPRLQLAPNSEGQIEKNENPRLDIQHPLEEMKEVENRWNAELTTYGWIDEAAGKVRIPIDEAKQLLLQRGLPTRQTKQPAPPAATGATVAPAGARVAPQPQR